MVDENLEKGPLADPPASINKSLSDLSAAMQELHQSSLVKFTEGFFSTQPETWAETNKGVTDFWEPHWTRSAADNRALIKFPHECINRVRQRSGPCIVLGAGPSLDKNIDALRDTKGIPIIACNSVMKALAAHGIEPEFCIVFDGKPRLVECFKGLQTPGTKYICSTCIHPDVVDAIRATGGQLRFFNKGTKGYAFFDRTLTYLYPREYFNEVPTGGCVVNASLYIAKFILKFDIFGLAGVDFGFTGNQFCATDYQREKKFDPETRRLLDGDGWTRMPQRNERIKEKPTEGTLAGIPVWQEHKTYGEVLYSYFANGGFKLVNCTEGGTMHRLPKMPLAAFISLHGRR